MRFTTLLLTPRGVVLRDLQAARLGLDAGPGRAAFDRFADMSPPGVYAAWAERDDLRFEARPGSALRDGMPVRVLPSPCAHLAGRFEKPASPCPYDAVRRPGVATLLASADGSEILESCRAAVLAWDGERLVHPPDDRPRVRSLAEEAVRRALPVRSAPLFVGDDRPLVLVNAVASTCVPDLPGRRPFPVPVLDALRALFDDLTS